MATDKALPNEVRKEINIPSIEDIQVELPISPKNPESPTSPKTVESPISSKKTKPAKSHIPQKPKYVKVSNNDCETDLGKLSYKELQLKCGLIQKETNISTKELTCNMKRGELIKTLCSFIK